MILFNYVLRAMKEARPAKNHTDLNLLEFLKTKRYSQTDKCTWNILCRNWNDNLRLGLIIGWKTLELLLPKCYSTTTATTWNDHSRKNNIFSIQTNNRPSNSKMVKFNGIDMVTSRKRGTFSQKNRQIAIGEETRSCRPTAGHDLLARARQWKSSGVTAKPARQKSKLNNWMCAD